MTYYQILRLLICHEAANSQAMSQASTETGFLQSYRQASTPPTTAKIGPYREALG